LRLTAIREGRVNLSQRKTGAWQASQAASFLVQQGDFLVVRGNGSRNLVGRGGLVEEVVDPVAYPDTLIRLRPRSDLCEPRFLRHLWQSAVIRQQVEQAAHTTAGIYKISQEDIQSFVLPLAPLAEQRRIVARVEALLAQADIIEQAVATAGRRIIEVERAVLARAFRGELVELSSRDDYLSSDSASSVRVNPGDQPIQSQLVLE
jgi:type I restriction enzyme, S subunit